MLRVIVFVKWATGYSRESRQHNANNAELSKRQEKHSTKHFTWIYWKSTGKHFWNLLNLFMKQTRLTYSSRFATAMACTRIVRSGLNPWNWCQTVQFTGSRPHQQADLSSSMFPFCYLRVLQNLCLDHFCYRLWTAIKGPPHASCSAYATGALGLIPRQFGEYFHHEFQPSWGKLSEFWAFELGLQLILSQI